MADIAVFLIVGMAVSVLYAIFIPLFHKAPRKGVSECDEVGRRIVRRTGILVGNSLMRVYFIK